MATRRSLNGSMTVVGDIAQATGPLAPDDWDDVLAHLPDRKPSRVIGLSVGYRIPAQIMELAEPGDGRGHARACGRRRRCASATSGPRITRVDVARPGRARRGAAAPRRAAHRQRGRGRPTTIAATRSPTRSRRPASSTAGPRRTGLDESVTVVPVSVVKGLELDAVVVVEPAEIVATSNERTSHGMRAALRGAHPQHPAPQRSSTATTSRAPLR